MDIFKRKKKTIYIHIGFMKTGTTAIQSFLTESSSFLTKNNFCFPEINKKAMNYLGFSLLDEVPPYVHHKLDLNREELYGILKKEINKSKEENIIISTEAYSLISTKYFLGDEAPFLLKDLLNEKHFNFKIIASLRRQDEYLISQYNQHIKTHNFYDLFHGDINKFYKDKIELFDFNRIIKRWEKAFGKDNIMLYVYNKERNSVVDFIKLLNIKDEKIDTIVKRETNMKMSEKGLQFMNIANKFEVIKRTAKQNSLLVDLIEKEISDKSMKASLSKDLSNRIIDDFNSGNIEISDSYFNGNYEWFESKTCDDLNQEENWVNGLTIEDAVKIATAIWNYYQKNN